MKEFVSVKVSSFDHDALATTLTSRSAAGWDVVGIVSVNSDIVAYLSRDTTSRPTPSTSDVSRSTEPAGWGAASSDTSSAPTEAVPTTESTVGSTAASSVESTTSSTPTPSVPADWYKDPSGRFEYRYWDGQKWTEHVSRSGTVHKDPPTP